MKGPVLLAKIIAKEKINKIMRGGNCMMGSLMIFSIRLIILGRLNESKKKKIGATPEKEEIHTKYSFVIIKEEDYVEDLGVDERRILKCILQNWAVVMIYRVAQERRICPSA
jgi:hypothetical protein